MDAERIGLELRPGGDELHGVVRAVADAPGHPGFGVPAFVRLRRDPPR